MNPGLRNRTARQITQMFDIDENAPAKDAMATWLSKTTMVPLVLEAAMVKNVAKVYKTNRRMKALSGASFFMLRSCMTLSILFLDKVDSFVLSPMIASQCTLLPEV